MRVHEMDLWPEMRITVKKLPKARVRSSISRTDFNRLNEVRYLVETMAFAEITIVRKVEADEMDLTSVMEMLSNLSEENLRVRIRELVDKMDRKCLEKTLLAVLSYERRGLLL